MGKATARRFVDEGARVIVADIQADKGAAVARDLGDAARFVHCDVRNEDQMREAVRGATESFGGLDIMFHLAATAGPQDAIHEISVEDWDDAAALLTRASMLAIKVAVPAMQARGGGSIILTSSAVAFRPRPTSPAAYVTAKAGILAMCKVAALRYAPDMIRVNSIVPGGFSTPIQIKRFGYSQ